MITSEEQLLNDLNFIYITCETSAKACMMLTLYYHLVKNKKDSIHSLLVWVRDATTLINKKICIKIDIS